MYSAQIVETNDLRALFAEHIHSTSTPFDIADAGGKDASTDDAQCVLYAGYDPAEICAMEFTSCSTGVPEGSEAAMASAKCSLAGLQRLFSHRDGQDVPVSLQQRYRIYPALINGHDVTISDPDHAAATARAADSKVMMGLPRSCEPMSARLLSRQTGHEVDQAARERAVEAVHLNF